MSLNLTVDALVYCAILFDDDKIVKNYINSVRHKELNNTCILKITNEDTNREYLTNNIFILIDMHISDPMMFKLLDRFSVNRNFLNQRDVTINNRSHVVVTFDYPFEHFHDLCLIKEGRYGKTSLEFKKLILSFWKIDKSSKVYYVFNNLGDPRTINKYTKNELGEIINIPEDPIPLCGIYEIQTFKE